MRSQVRLLASAVIISALAFVAAGDGMTMRSPLLSVSLWLLAIGLVVIAAAACRPSRQSSAWTRRTTAIVAGLTLLAVPLRLACLDRIPWLLTGDEGSVGLAALEFLDGGRNNIFGVSWFSFPSLFFLLPRLSVGILGRTIYALRLPSALAGIATIPALYWTARSMFGKTIALVSAAYLATYHFHVHFSRLAINNIWDALFITLFFGYFWRAWTSGRKDYFLTAGLVLGLAQYFYVSSRVLFLIVPAWLLLAALSNIVLLRRHIPGLAHMFIAAVVVALPLALFFTYHPDEFFAPMNRVLILGEPLTQESLRIGDSKWLLLWDQLRYTILGFFSAPSRLWYRGAIMLLTVPAALFLSGIILTIKRLPDLRYAWLSLLLLSAIMIGTITDYVPSSQRFVQIAPTIAIFVAIPISKLYSVARLSRLRYKQLLPVLAAALLFVAMAQDTYFYFGEYSPSRRFGDTETEVANAVVDQVVSDSPVNRVYMLGLPRMGFATHASMRYLLGDGVGYDVPDLGQGEYDFELPGPTLFIFLPERIEELQRVVAKYPGGVTRNVYGKTGALLFVTYFDANHR